MSTTSSHISGTLNISAPHFSLSGIQSQLESQRTELTNQAAVLRTQLSSLESDVQKIDAALSALSGNGPLSTAAKAPQAKERKKPTAPSAGKADVMRVMKMILGNNQPLSVDELRPLVEEEIVKEGFTRLGFALRFKEALGDSTFVQTPEGVGLA